MMQHSMSLPSTSTAMLVLGAMSASGAEVGVVIGEPPPPPRVETVPVAPVTGYVWRPGYWRWDEGRYLWIPGAYIVAPQPLAAWISGHWVPAGGGWMWVAGYWRS